MIVNYQRKVVRSYINIIRKQHSPNYNNNIIIVVVEEYFIIFGDECEDWKLLPEYKKKGMRTKKYIKLI
jgi:hypothetical protein